LELLSELLLEELLSELLLELVVPLSSDWLWVPVDPDDVVVLVAAVVELPPLPRAATASHAATKVASTPAATLRRRMRKRWLVGDVGRCMDMMVDPEPWILLGIRSAPGKSRRLVSPRAPVLTRSYDDRLLDQLSVGGASQGESKVT
jgi:hypothetical protein